MNHQPTKKPENKKKSVLAEVGVSLVVALVGTLSYMTLAKLKEQELVNESMQEQFVGEAQVSEQLQAECQKSAEKILSLSAEFGDVAAMFAEYKQNAENCREVYFALDKKAQIRSEGAYPDLAIDIAVLAAKNSGAQAAAEILNFAKSLNAWEFYMGPIVCNSKTTIDAYLESLNLAGNKICFKTNSDKEKLFSEIKNKNFSVLSASLNNDRVVSLGLINSEIGCPEKISTITKLVQKTAEGNYDITEERGQSTEADKISFIFKTKTEDKLVLEFAPVNDCLQLQSVLIPDLQANE